MVEFTPPKFIADILKEIGKLIGTAEKEGYLYYAIGIIIIIFITIMIWG